MLCMNNAKGFQRSDSSQGAAAHRSPGVVVIKDPGPEPGKGPGELPRSHILRSETAGFMLFTRRVNELCCNVRARLVQGLSYHCLAG